MTRYAAFLRAVNVGGTGKLPMADLRHMCADCGFADVTTYIASGNVALSYDGTADDAKCRLEARLAAYAGKTVGVMVRDAAELRDIVDQMPFVGAPGNKAVVMFLDAPPPVDALDHAAGVNGEEMALGRREIFVHYVDGQGPSTLAIPAAKAATARNMNTVRKMLSLIS